MSAVILSPHQADEESVLVPLGEMEKTLLPAEAIATVEPRAIHEFSRADAFAAFHLHRVEL